MTDRTAGPRTALDVDTLLDDPQTRVVVCCGAGGVGKTTTSAALAVRAAERGRRVVVLTIDPARRLAQAMGLAELDNTPRPVAGVDPAAGGALEAMMLDMKRTFDEVITAAATPDKAQQIFDNPFYQALSTSFAGTQEYMAMEKLGQLRAGAEAARARGEAAWDLIVVDTPPSRSALDFLDAPQRLGSFLDGRLIRVLTAPARVGGRAYLKVVSAAVGGATGILTKLLGAQILRDVQSFVAALDTVFGSFRERAEQTYRLLQQPGTAFVVVAAPERDALREASYFVERLVADGMPLAGLVLNRVQPDEAGDLSAERALAAAEDLDRGDLTEDATRDATSGATASGTAGPGTATDGTATNGDGTNGTPTDGAAADARRLTAALLRVHAERMQRRTREQALAARFTSAHPDVPVVEVAALAQDVHDLDGLREVGAHLSGAAGA